MSAELAVKRGASHAKKYAQLLLQLAVSHGAPLFSVAIIFHSRSSWPNLYDITVSILAD